MKRLWCLVGLVSLSCIVGCGKKSARESAVSVTAEPRSKSAMPLGDSAVPRQDFDANVTADADAVREETREQYDEIVDNPFQRVLEHPLSTFSIDVDTASYSKVRQYLVGYHRMPRPDAVRIEELVNYFQYDYDPPTTDQSEPFATHVAVAQCPWNGQHRLVRVALKGREMKTETRPPSNLVLLIDSSGSMKKQNKLPLLKRGMQMLLQRLNKSDRVSIVAYAGSAGMVLDSTPASESETIMTALDSLEAGGSTNGGAGLQLAYRIARDHFIESGVNRVLLCTDGDFNVGMTGTDQMIRFVQQEAEGGIELTVLGFGMGNLNDAMLEQISGRGNGNYAFIDTFNEAKKVLGEQLSGTLVTIAKDVKIQIEFNPTVVAAYRLIGYENRLLASEDFNDDRKDAGEIGAGHCVTALYEVVPAGVSAAESLPESDPLKYQEPPKESAAADSGELLTIKLRYKMPGQDHSQLVEHVAYDSGATFSQADQEFRFAAAVAGFGMLLRDSKHGGDWNYDSVRQVAESASGIDTHGLREEFLLLVAIAKQLDAKER